MEKKRQAVAEILIDRLEVNVQRRTLWAVVSDFHVRKFLADVNSSRNYRMAGSRSDRVMREGDETRVDVRPIESKETVGTRKENVRQR